MPEKPKPEQYRLELEESEDPKDTATENGKKEDVDDTETDEDEVKIVQNDDKTNGGGHPKDPSGWN
jgi:hypothetical protein